MRDLGTIAGVLVILACVIALNIYFRLDTLKEAAIKMRMALEQQNRDEGVELLDWELLRETEGTRKKGPTYAEDLTDQFGVNPFFHIVGFMAPLDQFRGIERFMLLPMPIECYFCEAPPLRDILFVETGEGKGIEKIFNEPILLHGVMQLNGAPGEPFFYSVERAGVGKSSKEQVLTEMELEDIHKQELMMQVPKLLGEEPDEVPLYAPDTAVESQADNP